MKGEGLEPPTSSIFMEALSRLSYPLNLSFTRKRTNLSYVDVLSNYFKNSLHIQKTRLSPGF